MKRDKIKDLLKEEIYFVLYYYLQNIEFCTYNICKFKQNDFIFANK